MGGFSVFPGRPNRPSPFILAIPLVLILVSGCITSENPTDVPVAADPMPTSLTNGDLLVLEDEQDVKLSYSGGISGWFRVRVLAERQVVLNVSADPLDGESDGTLAFRHIVLDPRRVDGESYYQALQYRYPSDEGLPDFRRDMVYDPWTTNEPARLQPGIEYVVLIADSRGQGSFVVENENATSDSHHEVEIQMAPHPGIQSRSFLHESIGHLPSGLAAASVDYWSLEETLPADSLVIQGGWLWYSGEPVRPGAREFFQGESSTLGCDGFSAQGAGLVSMGGFAMMDPAYEANSRVMTPCIELRLYAPGPMQVSGHFALTVIPLPDEAP